MTPLAPLIAELDALYEAARNDQFGNPMCKTFIDLTRALLPAYPALRAAALAAEGMAKALEELVACKDFIYSIRDEERRPIAPLYEEYNRRKPLAWQAARDALKAAPLSQEERG